MRACPSCGEAFVEGERFCPFDATRLEDVVSHVPPAPDPLIGAVLDERYRIVAPIGEGGMGRIYEAEHVSIGRSLAVKVLRDRESASAEVAARFRQEALSASCIGHENIVSVHDFGTTPSGASYLVMELLRGEDLGSLLRSAAPMPAWRAIPLLVQACAGLEAAHRAGIVHRDLKPENLFVTREEHGRETIKVVDFGLAKMSDVARTRGSVQKLTKTGMIFGTPRYMSPEQCLGMEADARSDVYALGVIAYELLAGVPPFDASSFLGVLHMHTSEPVPAMRERNVGASVSPRLEAIVRRALAKEPELRFPSMDAFSRALVSVVAETTPMRGPVFDRERDAALAEAARLAGRSGASPPVRSDGPAIRSPLPPSFVPSRSDAPPSHAPAPGAPTFTPPTSGEPARRASTPRPPPGPLAQVATSQRSSSRPSRDSLEVPRTTASSVPRPAHDTGAAALDGDRPEPGESPTRTSASAWLVPLLVVVSVGLGIAALAVAIAHP